MLPLLLLFALAILAAPAHAADDSNAGQLNQVPTVSASQLNSALGTLSQGVNNTQVEQLIAQFQSQMSAGNYPAADSTLLKLQNIAQTDPGSVPYSLNALLQSLSVGSNGPSINPNTLSSLLNSNSAYASGSHQSAQQLSVDMASLASLMQYANSTLASELLQNSSQLSNSAFSGGSGTTPVSVSIPGISGISNFGLPGVGSPGLGVGAPSAGLPSVPFTDFLVPILAVAVIGALFLSRGRLSRAVASQKLPGLAILRRSKAEPAPELPSDPRGKIEFYYGRAVNLMTGRGVSKHHSETHREFTAMCEGTPERPHVGTISSLYEKAVFSGQEVGGTDAHQAASSFLAMENQER